MMTRKSLLLVTLGLVMVISFPAYSGAAPRPVDDPVDQMEEMEELGLVGCNHAVTVTVLPLPGFTATPDPRSSSSSISFESSESESKEKTTASDTPTMIKE
ncbi:uncharacterized protein LOC131210106 [Anopheles bellator]|uniref:uncharacterized protein LOC131210106 n=1 Tax=Anopheles bellator TaxID=139047 RepID=UPI0026471018|nr:uncharacterized protein LOC131210106 [Anopheles bellator]